jgi:hypothetical protein
MGVEVTLVESLVGGIRDRLIAAVEHEAYLRIQRAKELTAERKTDLTSELEVRVYS